MRIRYWIDFFFGGGGGGLIVLEKLYPCSNRYIFLSRYFLISYYLQIKIIRMNANCIVPYFSKWRWQAVKQVGMRPTMRTGLSSAMARDR